MLPLAAGASTAYGELALSPARGVPGSHFMASFTFSEAPCDAYTVSFYWDVPNPGQPLGSADATGTGPTCHVSMELVVPSTDAVPNHSYPVGASAQTKQVNAGNSSTVVWSSRDSATSQFEVTGPAPSASPSGADRSTPGYGSTVSTPVPGGPASGSVGPVSAAGGGPTSAGAPATSPSPDAAGGLSSSSGTARAPSLAIQQANTAAAAGHRGTILIAGAAVFVLLVAALWTRRTGRFRAFLRR